ncbi:MAG: MAPEG family protein [Woeseiaceae bacterium]
MEAIAVVTTLLIAQAFVFAFMVGRARQKTGTKAPAMSGPPEFERAFRVHQNTIEQLIIVLPGMWMFGYFIHPGIAAGLGLVFFITRFIYRSSYLADPSRRDRGFLPGAIVELTLILGSLAGAVMSFLRT